MKKLMIALAAVATAIGLRAADAGFLSGAGFDSTDADGTVKLTWTSPSGFVEGYWTGTNAENAIITPGTAVGVVSRPAYFTGDPDRTPSHYLAVNTGKGLISQKIKTLGTQTIDTDKGLYFDGLVQFTAFDEMPTIADGAKIALFPMLNDSEDESKGTNLWISAWGNATNLWKTAATIDDDGWHRVTIKMINNVYKTGSKVGFVVYIDGSVVSCVAAKIADESDLTSEAKYFNKDSTLFLSLGDSAEMTEVAFGGKGAIDEIAFTETAPSFAGSPKFAYLTGAENIASFKYTTETWSVDDDALEVMLVGMDTDTVTVTDIQAVQGYFPTNVAETITVTAGKTNEVGFAKVLGATVVINDVPQYFETAAEALEALNDVTEATTATLTLNLDSGAIEIEKANLTLTLDLAGKKIEGDTDVITVSEGSLTITNSTDTIGKVVATGKDNKFVAVKAIDEEATLNITAGIFDGEMKGSSEDAEISITGGKFLASKNEAEELNEFAPEGFEFVADGQDPEYFILQPESPKTGTVIFICEKTGFEMNQTNNTTEIGEPVPFPTITETDTTKYIGWFKEATFENPADTTVQAGENTYYAKVVDAVAKIGTEKYETIEAAYTAAEAGDTITMIASSSLAGQLKIEKNLTITATSSDITLTGPSGAYGLVIAADVTLAGGTIQALETETRSIVNVGNPAGGDFGETAFVGNLIIDGATIKGTGNASAGNAIAAANGTVQIKSGAITKIGSRGVKAEGTATITIDGGTITRNGEQPTLYTKESGKIIVNAGAIDGLIKVDSKTSSITIPGTSTATFDRDQTAFCAVGYLTKLNSEEPARYAVVPAVAVTGVALSESAVTIAPDATTNLTATLTPANADVKEAAWSTSAAGVATVADGVVTAVSEGKATITYTVVDYYNTTNSASCEVTVAAAPAPTPIDPTQPEPFEDPELAQKRAEAINADKTLITVPTGFTGNEDIYRGAVAAKSVATAAGGYEVVIDIADEAAVQTVVDADAVKAIADLTTPEAEIDAVPGLYYSVISGATLEGMTEGTRVPATSNKVTLQFPRGDNAGFYKINVSATPSK